MRVVLMSNHSLLSAGVQRLLEGADGLELAVVEEGDLKTGSKMQAFAPEVIIVDSGDTFLDKGIVPHVLKKYSRARVIALNVNRRSIEVYRMQRVLPTDLDGLLCAIRGSARQSGKVICKNRECNK